MRAYRQQATGEYINKALPVMRDGGISSLQDWVSLKQRFMEEKRVNSKHVPSLIMKVIYATYWARCSTYRRLKCTLY